MASDTCVERVELNQVSKSWYVYMIRAHDNSLYTGITTDVERRFAEHKGEAGGAFKGAKALRSKRNLKLVFVHAIDDRSQASKLESQRYPSCAKASPRWR